MVPDDVLNPVISGFSLSLLEDSGWYSVNNKVNFNLFYQLSILKILFI